MADMLPLCRQIEEGASQSSQQQQGAEAKAC
jgi:hypothetical protein